MSEQKKNGPALYTAAGAPVANNQDSITAGARGPVLLEDVWLIEKLAHFDREVIPERRMHAKGSGAFGTFTVTQRAERQGRNPKTGEALTIAASKAVKFKAAKPLREAVDK